ncbi:hypothetical protein JB92DRAFT_2890137 [Gautieria morchelliformis]|nr:hypothetical protein JB92DRAFT_2890137 [Gautieria morchelliformis]
MDGQKEVASKLRAHTAVTARLGISQFRGQLKSAGTHVCNTACYTHGILEHDHETRPLACLTMDRECRDSKLTRLDLYKLPPSPVAIAESFSRYNFTQFYLELDWVEAIGSVEGVVSGELKVRLGTRVNGSIEFVEQGSQVEALVGVLDHYSTRFPDDVRTYVLVAKWIDDALGGAIHPTQKQTHLFLI